MALDELVRYVARCCASRRVGYNMYEMAEKYDWPADRVLAFLRCKEPPTPKMLRDLARELETPFGDLKRILDR